MSSPSSLCLFPKHVRNCSNLRIRRVKCLHTTSRHQQESQNVFRRLEPQLKQKNRNTLYLVPNASENAQPQGLALLLGWLKSGTKTVGKYADIYLSRNIASYCFVPTLPDTWFLHSSKRKAEKFLRAIDQSPDTHHQSEPIPLIVHLFSAGSLPYLCALLPYLAKPSSPLQLRGLVFDSGPTEFSYRTGTTAAKLLYEQGAISGLTYCVGILGGITSNLLVGSQRRAERVDFLKHSAVLSTPQLHMYSERDPVYTVAEVRSTIHQQMEKGATVQERGWQDSSHVRMFVDHPEEYREEVDRFIAMCLNLKH